MKNLAAVVKGCVALLILAYVLPLPTAAQNHPDAPSEEYKIYEAVLGLMDHIPKDNPRVNIYNTTLNGKCGEVTENATPLANLGRFWGEKRGERPLARTNCDSVETHVDRAGRRCLKRLELAGSHNLPFACGF